MARTKVQLVGDVNGGANFSGIVTSNTLHVGSSGTVFYASVGLSSVGVGTTNPKYTLDVVGDINFSGTFRQGGTQFVASRWTTGIGDDIYRLSGDVGIGTTNPIGQLQISSGPVIVGAATSTGTASQTLQVTGGAYVSGNLGIGATNPSTKLQVGGVIGFNDTNIKIGDSTTGSSITSGTNNICIGGYAGFSNQGGLGNNFVGSQAGYANQSGVSNNFIGFSAGFSNQSGNSNNFIGVAAGTSNQTGSNNIFLGARNGISASASYKVIIGSGYLTNYFDSPSTTKDYQFAVGIRTDANASKYWLVGDENFNVGIGTTNPSTALQVNGTATVTTLVETSSITLKENINPIVNALDKVIQLNPVTYDRKSGESKNEAGLIAEEVNDIIPNIVSKDDEGNPNGINYTKLSVYLIDAIKELKKQIDELKG